MCHLVIPSTCGVFSLGVWKASYASYLLLLSKYFFLKTFKSSARLPSRTVTFGRATNSPVSRSGRLLNVTSRRDHLLKVWTHTEQISRYEFCGIGISPSSPAVGIQTPSLPLSTSISAAKSRMSSSSSSKEYCFLGGMKSDFLSTALDLVLSSGRAVQVNCYAVTVKFLHRHSVARA